MITEGIGDIMEDRWMSTNEAAEYLGINQVHFRRSILPAMRKMELNGIGRLGESKNSGWRFKQSALDEYLERSAAVEV